MKSWKKRLVWHKRFTRLGKCAFGAALVAGVAMMVIPMSAFTQRDHWQKPGVLIEFDPPGAATTSSPVCFPSCGTQALANNAQGEVVGFYTDVNIVPHGFLRVPTGRITSFDAPGAGLGAGLNEGTVALAINDRGVIVGQFQDDNFVFHGFIRYADGSFITFDAPGAGNGPGQGTQAEAINHGGQVAGYYLDAANVFHGFLREEDGDIVSFDAAGAGTGPFQGTVPSNGAAISPQGAIVGSYLDGGYVLHGFVRDPEGEITTVDPPGAGTGISFGALLGGINSGGDTTGYYGDSNDVLHGFLRRSDGDVTVFDVPGGGAGLSQGTSAFKVNPRRAITGIWIDSNNVLHGFVHDPDGTFVKLDARDAGTAAFQGTRPEAINQEGEVTGFYIDVNFVNHGFVVESWSRRMFR